MDTQKNIDALQSFLATITSQIDGLVAQKEALTVAISQLKGTLVTQMIELEAKYQAQISDLQAKIDNLESLSTKESTNATTI